MAVDQMNDSYNRCLQELRARYRGRGIAGNLRGELELQAKQDIQNQSDDTAYLLFSSGARIADQYRSGVYNGSKYMTSDDFVRYFRNRRTFNMPAVVKARETVAKEAEAAEVAPVRQNGRGVGNRNSASSENAKEGHLATAKSALKAFAGKWFPVERREGRTEGAGFRIPAAALSGIAVFTISLGLIVGGSVMIGSASADLGQQKSEIARLEAQQSDLQGKLDLKYNVSDIEAEAKSLGMIKRQYADSTYVKVNGKEEITIYEDGKDEKSGLAALLSSFGIELNP